MKKRLITSFLFLLGLGQLSAQSSNCGFVFDKRFRDSTFVATTYDYLNFVIQKGVIREGKGIVMLTTYQDEQGRECWSYKARVDDRYLDNPPLQWTMIPNITVILLYKGVDGMFGGVDGREVKTNASPEQAKCLETLIGDRVYKRTTENKRMIVLKDQNKDEYRLVPDPNVSRYTGNDSDNIIYVFEKDGKVTKVTPY